MKRETKATYSGNPKIRAAQKRNDTFFLNLVKSHNRYGELFSPVLPGLVGWHALDRLQARGLVKFRKYIAHGSGYIATALVGKVKLACS